jgi:hypothetical protein
MPVSKCTMLITTILGIFTALVTPVAADVCKCYPGEDCWPSPEIWATLNASVHGRLALAIPAAAACYEAFGGIPTADEERCESVRRNWGEASWQYNTVLLTQ